MDGCDVEGGVWKVKDDVDLSLRSVSLSRTLSHMRPLMPYFGWRDSPDASTRVEACAGLFVNARIHRCILWTTESSDFGKSPTFHTLKPSKMDVQRPYSLSVLPPDLDTDDESRSSVQAHFRNFILEFRLDSAFIYRCFSPVARKSLHS